MKSLLIFIPNELYKRKYGYIFGKIINDVNSGIKKFFVIDVRESDYINSCKSSIDIIGYYYGTENSTIYTDKKCSDWLNLGIFNNKSDSSCNYYIKNIIFNNKKINITSNKIVLIIYDRTVLKETELFLPKSTTGNHFYELRKILNRKQVKKEIERKSMFQCIKETLLIYHMLLYYYPIILLTKITNKLMPVLKYSSLGIHTNSWLENNKWMLICIIRDKKLTLKTGNYICTMVLDMLLGILILQLLLHSINNTPPSEVLLINAEQLVENLQNIINWLMGAPAGLKLNYMFNNVLGKFFLYHIDLWWTFLLLVKPIMDFAFNVLLLFGGLGLTFQVSIAADLLALISFHSYCIYVYAARFFNIQLRALTALFRLFLGKKKNPLRERVDTCQYQPEQLFIGTLLFTIILFLMPTTWVYYAVFTSLRLILIGVGGLLTRVKYYLQIMPIYTSLMWIFHSNSIRGDVDLDLYSSNESKQVALKMTLIVSSWSRAWSQSIPDTIIKFSPVAWSKTINNIIWGQLLHTL